MILAAAWLLSAAIVTIPLPDPAQGRWSSRGPDGGDVYAIAVDPADAQVMYAAVGSIYTNEERIGGLFQSRDGGSTWKEIGPPDAGFFTVAVAPSDSRLVFASSREGLWKSADGGVHWNMVLPGVSWPVPPAIDPADALHVWVVSDGAAWRTIDGGSTWSRMLERDEAISFDSGIPSRLHLVRYVDLFDDVVLRFAYSDDRGATWVDSTTVGNPSIGKIVSDPADPGTLYTTGRPIFRSTDRGISWIALPSEFPVSDLAVDPLAHASLYAADGNGLFVSRDSGVTWTQIFDEFVRSVTAAPIDGRTRIFAGSFRGLFVSDDDGETWAASNRGLRGAYWQALAADWTNSSRIYTVGRTGFAVSTDGGATWTENLDSPASGRAIAVDPSDSSHILASGWSAAIVRSRDAGATWETAFAGAAAFTGPISFDPASSSIVYASDFFPLKSTDGGGSWRVINNGTGNIGVMSLAIDSADSSILFAASSLSFFRSTDAGETWVLDPVSHSIGTITAIVPDPVRPGVLWVGTSSGLLKLVDSGELWTVTGFSGPVTAIAVDAVSGAVYVSSGEGRVFRSLAEGFDWTPFGSGLPPLTVQSLAVDAATGVIHAATANGVYSLDLRRRPRVVVR